MLCSAGLKFHFALWLLSGSYSEVRGPVRIGRLLLDETRTELGLVGVLTSCRHFAVRLRHSNVAEVEPLAIRALFLHYK